MNKNIKTRFLNRRFWKFGLVFLAVFFVLFSNFGFNFDLNIANAGIGEGILAGASTALPGFGTGWYIGKAIDDGDVSLNPFKWLLAGVLKFCIWLIGVAVILFDFVIDPKNVYFIINNDGLYTSWAMVRDFLNLGFILVLLYIAFCVIFQIGSYADGWKKMLLMMVIMALLVNFSFPICRFIIDVSNIAFYYLIEVGFASGSDGSSIFTNLAAKSNLATVLNVKSISVGELMARVIFTFIFGLTLFVIAVLFVVRMVALGLLIIFSPIGFAGAAFPFSKKYASDWWDNLFKYAFFAPIMIFMIIIASKLMENASNLDFEKSVLKNTGMESVEPGFIGNMAFFTIPVVVLWYGMQMAQKMSIAGASEVTGMANKAAKWVGRNFTGQAGLGRAGLRKFDRDVLMNSKRAQRWANKVGLDNLSPRAFVEGWKKRAKEIDENALAKASGGQRDRLNKFWDGAKTNYKQMAIDQIKSKKLKELKESSENTMYHLIQAESLIGSDDEGARNILDATFRIGYGNRDQNDIVKHILKNYTEKGRLAGGKSYEDVIGVAQADLKAKGLDGVSGYSIGFFADKLLQASKMEDEERLKTISDLDEIAASTGGVGYGSVVMNDKGEYKMASCKEEQAAEAVGKVLTLGDAQEMARKLHQNWFNNETTGDVNIEFAELVKSGTLSEIKEHITRHKSDMYKKVGRDPKVLANMRKMVSEMETTGVGLWRDGKIENVKINATEKKIATDYIDTLEKFSAGKGK